MNKEQRKEVATIVKQLDIILAIEQEKLDNLEEAGLDETPQYDNMQELATELESAIDTLNEIAEP